MSEPERGSGAGSGPGAGAEPTVTVEHKRKHPRAPYAVQVRFFEWDRARTAQGTQISEGGLFLKTNTPLPEGALVTVRIGLPGVEQSFTVLAQVVRTVRGGMLRDSGMGLKFVDIGANHRELIAQYVASRR